MNGQLTRRWSWLGAVALAIMAFQGLQIAVGDPPDGGGDPSSEHQLEDVKSGSVDYDDGHVDESGEDTAGERITFGLNDEVTIVSRWFNAPTGWSFKPFPPPFDYHYADVKAGGGANFAGDDEFDGGRVYVWGQYDSQTAEVFPLYAEGNLSGGGGSGGTGGSNPHWAAKIGSAAVFLDIARWDGGDTVDGAIEDTTGSVSKCYFPDVDDSPASWAVVLPRHEVVFADGASGSYRIELQKLGTSSSPGKAVIYRNNEILMGADESLKEITQSDLSGTWTVLGVQTGAVDITLRIVKESSGGGAYAATGDDTQVEDASEDTVRFHSIVGVPENEDGEMPDSARTVLRSGKIILVAQDDEFDKIEKDYQAERAILPAITKADQAQSAVVLIGRRATGSYGLRNARPKGDVIVAGLGGTASKAAGANPCPDVTVASDPAIPTISGSNGGRHFDLIYENKFKGLIGLRLIEGLKGTGSTKKGGRAVWVQQAQADKKGEIYIGYSVIEDNDGPAVCAEFRGDTDATLIIQRNVFKNNLNPYRDSYSQRGTDYSTGGSILIAGHPNHTVAKTLLENTPSDIFTKTSFAPGYTKLDILVHQNVIEENRAMVGGGLAICGLKILDNIQLTGVPVAVIDNRIKDNGATWRGGGVFLQGVLTTGTEFRENCIVSNDGTSLDFWVYGIKHTLEADGGGVAIKDFPAVKFVNDEINDNATAGDGGGLYVTSFGLSRLEGVKITSNVGQSNGGGVHLTFGGMLRVVSCNINSNSSPRDDGLAGGGGGVYVRNARFWMQGGSVNANTAGLAGGGIVILASRDDRIKVRELSATVHPIVELNSIEIKNNTSSKYGGGALTGFRYIADSDWHGWNQLFKNNKETGRSNSERKILYLAIDQATISGNQNPATSEDSHNGSLGKIGGVYLKDVSDTFYPGHDTFRDVFKSALDSAGLLAGTGLNIHTVSTKWCTAYNHGISATQLVKDTISNSVVSNNQGMQFVAVNDASHIPWHPSNFVETGNTIASPKVDFSHFSGS